MVDLLGSDIGWSVDRNALQKQLCRFHVQKK